MKTSSGTTTVLDWAAASEPLRGQPPCGDASVVVETADRTVIAVIDGLGHGAPAAEAAKVAVASITHTADQPIAAIVQECHTALAAGRGAVMSIAVLERGEVTWVGVGNVEGVLLQSGRRERLLLWGGVVGHNLPRLRPSSLPIATGDVLVFATDGIALDFPEQLGPPAAPAIVVSRIFSRSYLGRDDGLVLVARYRGAPR
jgi:negative regulator of sigma-B (phosphoserine phosphatase)